MTTKDEMRVVAYRLKREAHNLYETERMLRERMAVTKGDNEFLELLDVANAVNNARDFVGRALKHTLTVRGRLEGLT